MAALTDCDKKFANTSNFRMHLVTHSAKEQSNRDYNDASGRTNTPLTDSHKQSGDKDCDKNSTRQMLTHSSEKKHKCKYCDKAFFRSQ